MHKIYNTTRFLFIIILCICSLFAVSQEAMAKEFVVVLDAGHGGKDPGAIGKKVKEKDINLEIVLKLGELIIKNHTDVKVVYTRSKDVFVELGERAKIANRNNADLFISVHTNAAQSKSACGTETYALGLAKTEENLQVAKRENSVILLEEDYTTKYEGFDPTSTESYIMFDFMQGIHLEQSINLASKVQEQFKSNAKRSDRGVRQAGFWVLRATSMPSILVEVGYISNYEEEKYLALSSSRLKLAESIYNAFNEYKSDWSRKQQGAVTTPSNESSININEYQPQPNIQETEEITSKEDYRIQIMASDKQYKTSSSLFKGLSKIKFYKENGLYKYTYGSYKTKADASKELPKIKKLFKDAFVVHFINDKKIKN
ncbi:MAG: N-acetylmuramoyl-L-alanine amidase [Bacteroidales bacterium]|nr:N-acetylmuramoyl-L-alanine amidase [Bacteroidales bacterium]